MMEDLDVDARTGPLRLDDAFLSLITDDEQGPVFCRADVREMHRERSGRKKNLSSVQDHVTSVSGCHPHVHIHVPTPLSDPTQNFLLLRFHAIAAKPRGMSILRLSYALED